MTSGSPEVWVSRWWSVIVCHGAGQSAQVAADRFADGELALLLEQEDRRAGELLRDRADPEAGARARSRYRTQRRTGRIPC